MRHSLRLALLVLVVLIFGIVYSFQADSRAQSIQPSTDPPPSCIAAPPGMVAWWAGEGNADDIRGENNGTLQGSPTFPAGEVEHAFGFNGSSQYVEIGDSPSLSMSDQLTIDAWIKPNSTSNDQSIVSKYNTCSVEQRSYSLELRSGGAVQFCVYNGQPDPNAYRCVLTSSGAITAGVFTHVAGTFDTSGQVIKIYVNGVDTNAPSLAGSVNVNSIFDSNTPVDIGRTFCAGTFGGPGDYFNGLIDETEIFSRALLQGEIHDIYLAGPAGKCRPRCVPPPDNLVGWWTGDDNPFDIWNQNHGTFESGPSPSASPYVDGKVGRAFNFNGSGSYVDLDNHNELKLIEAEGITIDAWVRPTGIPSGPVFINQDGRANTNQLGGGFEGILTKWQSPQLSTSAQPEQAGDSYGLWLASEAQAGKTAGAVRSEQTGGTLTLYGAVETDCGGSFSLAGGTIPLNVWSHVVMTYDSSTGFFALYVNGVQVTSETFEEDCSIVQTNTQVNIGCQTCGAVEQPVDPFQGQIDEVELFDRAINSSEVWDINNGAAAGKCKPCYPPPFGMVGWWTGDANSNDTSGSGNNGTLEGAAGYAFGKVSQAFKFNGTDAAVVAPPSSVPVMNQVPLTVDAWVKPALRTDGTIVNFFPNNAVSNDRAGFSGHGFGVNVLSDGSEMTIEYQDGFRVIPGVSFNADQWYHIAVVYTAGNVKSYVDGLLVDNFNYTQGPLDSTSPVFIGKHNDDDATYGTRRFFKGLIDEVEIFDRELSLPEIQSIVAAGASGKCKGTCNFFVGEANRRDRTATTSRSPRSAPVGGNHPDVNQTDQVGDASVTLVDIADPGCTDYQTLPTYQQGPMPFGYGNPLEIADISTSATFNGNVTVCFNLQSITDQTLFNQLRLLHLEGNILVDRTTSHDFATRSLCATTTTLSPFVISQNPNAGPSAAPASVSGQVTRPDGSPLAGVVMQLSGNIPELAITDSNGFYSFAELDTNGFYTVTPALVNYSFTPFQRSFSLLANTDAVFTGTPNPVVTGSPIDTTGYFVRQNYLDFLNREPDESGFNFWSNNILSCGNDASCLEVRRINTSAAYFLSIEFQQTGYLVYRMYKTAYGDLPGAPVPVRFTDFMPDTREIGQNVIVNRAGWEQTLESNKQAFADAFVGRTRFTALYGALDDAQFVNALNQNAGSVLTSSERDALLTSLTARRQTRAQVLRAVAENAQLARQEFNKAFVLMEYFGYLRRDPNAGPDADFGGYNFWLSKLDQFNGDFERAEMVRAFINSGEYRGRFPR